MVFIRETCDSRTRQLRIGFVYNTSICSYLLTVPLFRGVYTRAHNRSSSTRHKSERNANRVRFAHGLCGFLPYIQCLRRAKSRVTFVYKQNNMRVIRATYYVPTAMIVIVSSREEITNARKRNTITHTRIWTLKTLHNKLRF